MKVLLTKKLPLSDLELVQSWGWHFDTVETLRISAEEVPQIPEGDVWVISSRNSWSTVKKFLHQSPSQIYCIGHWIKDELLKVGTRSGIRNFENMKSLAPALVRENFHQIVYFCGEEHRPDLEEGLKDYPVSISKVITHQSQMTFPTVKNDYDAVFIFSPRSGESLLQNNVFPASTVFACIGPTTAAYLNTRTVTNTFVPSYPDSGILLQEFHSQIKRQILNKN